jgi:hypothetical protein
MLRRIAVVVLALTLNPVLAGAQEAAFTVTVPSADVHKGPSIATPVIGHVSSGTVLRVSRNLGSWARVAWPGAPDGVAYVHMTMGRLGGAGADAIPANLSPRLSSAPGAGTEAAAYPTTMNQPVAGTAVRERMAVSGGPNGAPITHIVGLGALVGSRSGFGATARAWRTDHLGMQVAIARDAMTSDVAGGRLTSIRLEPGVVYGLFDRVTDYVWIRPYVGSVVSFGRQTLKASAPIFADGTRESAIGVRVFGGSELTFASVPRFGVSVELGYRRFPKASPGFEPERLSVAIAGHWYVR